MLHYWLTSAATYQFAESINEWRLPTLDPHLFAAVLDWLTKGSRNWHLPEPDNVLELMATAHYLDLPKLVDQCLDVVATAEWVYHIDSFGGLAPCLIRAVMRRTDPLGLMHTELVLAKDHQQSQSADKTMHGGGESTKPLWIQHLARIAGGGGPDVVQWPLGAEYVSTGTVRRMVLGLMPANRRRLPFLGRERHMEAVALPLRVGDEEARWVARLAKRTERPLHLVLERANWPPWTDQPGSQQQQTTSSMNLAHGSVRLSPVGDGPVGINVEGVSEDNASDQAKHILVQGTATVWTISPTSSAIPTLTWPLTRLTLDSCPSLSHLSSNGVLCTWLTSPESPLTHLTISNSLSLDGMSLILSAASTHLRSLTLDRNPIPCAGSPTSKSVHQFLKTLRATQLPHLFLCNAHLPPATLAAILAAWPPSSQVPVLALPGMGLGSALVPRLALADKLELTGIHLANNRLVARTLVDLVHHAGTCAPHLRVLDVSGNQISAAVVAAVAETLPRWPRVHRLGLNVRAAGPQDAGVVDPLVWQQLFTSLTSASKAPVTLLVDGHALVAWPHSAATSGDVLAADDLDAMRAAILACVARTPMCIVLGDTVQAASGLAWWRQVVHTVDAHQVTVWSRAGIVSNAL